MIHPSLASVKLSNCGGTNPRQLLQLWVLHHFFCQELYHPAGCYSKIAQGSCTHLVYAALNLALRLDLNSFTLWEKACLGAEGLWHDMALSGPMQLAIASYLWRSRSWVGWIVLILQLNICTYIAQFNQFNQEWMSTQWIYQNLRDVVSLHLNNLNTKWMNLFRIWQIQLTNISPHPASSWRCRSSNQVIWLWLRACHMVTALAFKCIGLSFLLMGF